MADTDSMNITSCNEHTDCEAGKYTSVIGTTTINRTCTIASIGHIPNSDQSSQVSCNNGYVQPNTGQSSCIECVNDTYDDGTEICKDWTVSNCSAGFQYIEGTNSTNSSCVACETIGINYFQPFNNTQVYCTPWNIHQCNKGYEFRQGSSIKNNSCTLCFELYAPLQKYQPNDNTLDACIDVIECGENEYEHLPPTSSNNRECSQVTPCEAGKYKIMDATETANTLCNFYTVLQCSTGYGLYAEDGSTFTEENTPTSNTCLLYTSPSPRD